LCVVAIPLSKTASHIKSIFIDDKMDLTKEISFTGKNELGALSLSFNEVLRKTSRLVGAIKVQSTHLADIGQDLGTHMTQTAAAINQIASNIAGVKTLVINQSEVVTSTSSSLEQVGGSIGQLNQTVETQTEQVSRSASSIEQMIANIQSVTATLENNVKSVDTLTDASQVGKDGIQEVSASILEISKASEGLLEINAVMENIASQTNLLSMNAAIEAAHAGEAGKGFSVVADEIRKLAENSSAQSKIISDTLKKIIESINKVNARTDDVLHKFAAIENSVDTVSTQTDTIKAAMEEQNGGGQLILEAIGVLQRETTRLKDEAGEIHSGSTEVIAENKTLQAKTLEITQNMNEMATGAEQINDAIRQVNTITDQNTESLALLAKEVALFMTDK
jgi:methyl-accepting chemotaxis protein